MVTPPAPAVAHPPSNIKSAIVVGGGVAGIAAALRLAQDGVAVTLLETRRKLGGRATSFTDVRTGETLDNCQHVAMGCCTNYLDLCARLGVADKLAWTRRINWVEPGGRVSILKPGLLPAPAHMTGSFLTAAFLNLTEKMAIARAMFAILTEDRARVASQTFSEWLAPLNQPPSVVHRFWTPVIVSACNLPPHRVAASCALHVFQEGFLANRHAPDIALARIPLVELYDPAETAIRTAGGVVRLGVSVERIRTREVETAQGETLAADAVICAAPAERTARMVDDEMRRRDPRFPALDHIEHSPILGVHLTFDRPVMSLPHCVLLDRPTQWLFRKSPAGDRAHAVISAADDWMDLTEDDIAARVLDDIRACLPAARAATLLRARAVKEKRATFAPTPATEAIRPATTGPSGIILAGDWVNTGWPATMEGAARSGYLAAAAALGRDVKWALRPDLRPALIYRILNAAL